LCEAVNKKVTEKSTKCTWQQKPSKTAGSAISRNWIYQVGIPANKILAIKFLQAFWAIVKQVQNILNVVFHGFTFVP
tara:strand:+ start:292 stop:522 length:231 start_codon:yes stop_codon:yes gene_type:complete